MSFDGTLKFDTAIDKTGFKLGVDSLGSLAKKGMAIVTSAVGAASAATAALGGYAVSVGKGFEKSMAQVGATLGLSVEDIANNAEVIIGGTATRAGEAIDKFSAKAEEMGAKTSFSASQAADGLNILAMSGYGVEEAISIINSTLDLAAAGGIALADSASYITGSMKGFASEASNFADETEASAYYADIMAKGATLAATDVNNLGIAMSGAAAIADSYRQNSTETAVALLRLAEQGEIGSAAATSLAAAMKDLYSPTDTAKQVLDSLGVSAYTASGEAKDFNKVVDDLDTALSSLTDKERSNMERAIFGIQGKAAFDKMIVSTEDKVQSFYDGLSKASGSAATQSQTMLDNLEGDLTIMNSAAEGFGISIYKSLNDPLRDLVKKGTGYLGQLTEAFKEDGFNGLAESFGDVAADAVSTLAGYVPKFADIAVSLLQSLIGGLTENAPKIAEGGVAAVKSLALGILSSAESLIGLGVVMIREILSGIADALPDVLDAAVSLFFTLTDGIMGFFPEFYPIATKILQTFATALTDNLPLIIPQISALAYGILDALTGSEAISTIIGAALPIITALADGLFAAAPIVYDMLPKIVGNLFDILKEVAPDFGRAGLELMKHLARGIIEVAPQMLAAMGEIVIAIADGLKDYFPEVWKAAKEVLGELWEIVTEIAGEFLENIGNYLSDAQENFKEWLGEVIDAVISWAGDIVEKAKEAASEFVTGAMTFFDELPGKIGEMLGKALGAVAKWAVETTQKAKETASEFIENVREFIQQLPSIAKEHLDNMISNVREWASEITLKAKNTAREFLENIKESIRQLPSAAKEHLDNTISKVREWADDLKNKGKKAADDLVEKITSTISSLPDKMAESGRNLVQGLWNGITGAGDWLKSKISEFGGGIIDGFKESFGIHSPSTVMRDQVGKYLAEGIGVGFTENMPDLAAAAQRTADKLGSLDIPDISRILQLTISDIEIPEIELPKLEIEVPEIEIDLPKLTIDIPDIDLPDFPDDDDRKPQFPRIDSSAYQALDGGIASANSSIAPQPTSAVYNNYSYSTTTNNNSSETAPVQPMTINVKLDLNGEDFAEGFVDIAADKIDERQGVTVELKKRGLAR